ncbi:hypothetical protein BACCIP111883_04530 [Sutcliffiella rhizosphaerae]|uniref:Carrier domain-containing protein n=2 Tax=Sutcliffiella rhizosphaerae TaxID=2880967 RepID=A0ABM8YUR4_9BACI|nr:hypothetical protein BACCIP111883_04530 [Sutcliffiella rhizosphaerae]
MNIKERVTECLFRLGIEIEDDESFELSETITDSFFFITIILELEQEFDIEIPDDYLSIDLFQSIDHLTEIITEKLIK